MLFFECLQGPWGQLFSEPQGKETAGLPEEGELGSVLVLGAAQEAVGPSESPPCVRTISYRHNQEVCCSGVCQ